MADETDGDDTGANDDTEGDYPIAGASGDTPDDGGGEADAGDAGASGDTPDDGGETIITTTATFGSHFNDCMSAAGLPVPTSLFTTLTTATATIAAIQKAVAAYGAEEVTISALIATGALPADLAVAGGVAASFFAGACVGCLGSAGIDWLTD